MRRDPFGLKPLYRLEADPVSAFFDCGVSPAERGEPVAAAILEELVWGDLGDPWRSFWSGVTRVPAGHALDEDGAIRPWFQRPDVEPDRKRSAHDTLERFRRLLWESVERSVAGASEVAISMSGGLDSCALAAIAVDILGPSRVYAVTVSSTGDYEDHEPEIARRVARYLGIEWAVVESAGRGYHACWDSCWLWPLPPTPVAMAEWDALMPSRDHGVCIWGLGGDSLQRGDTRHYRRLLSQGRIGGIFSEMMTAVLVHGSRPGLGLFRGRTTPEHQTEPQWLHPSKEDLFKIHAQHRVDHEAAIQTGLDELFDPYFSHIFERYWPRKPGDAAYVMPFFDLPLVEFMATVPTVPWSLNKELLRAAMRGYLPEDVRLRPKALAGPSTVEVTLDDLAMIRRWLSSETLRGWVVSGYFDSTLRGGRVPWSELADVTTAISLARWLETYT